MSLLPSRLEQADKDDDSGATATAMFLRNDVLVVSHIGDSCVVPTILFNYLSYVCVTVCCVILLSSLATSK